MSVRPCWVIKGCGRERGGDTEAQLGTCPAYPDRGHSCWLVTGTLCGGEIQGTFAQKEMNCLECEVYERYNLRTGTDRLELIGQCQAELSLLQHGDAAGNVDVSTPEETLERLSASVGDTLEARIQQRTRELLAANEKLVREIEERKRIENQIRFMAYHDALTGLPNRTMLEQRLAEEISRSQREESTLAVLFIDLDRFKTINDTLGHCMGDELLKALANRLQENVRKHDFVARLSGDEFVIAFSNAGAPVRLVSKINDRLKVPFLIGGRKLHLTCSIGIAVYPGDGADPQELLKNADVAMYRAKDLGRNSYQFYEPEMNERAAEQATLETALAEALERSEFVLEYQPQVDLETGEMTGVEALIRWHHPEWGIISPMQFIPLAEETGLIVPIGEWVLRSACNQAKAWQEAGYPPVRIAVNLSARQFRQQVLAKLVEDVLKETGLGCEWLDLEITESDIMLDTANTIAQLRKLRDQGVQVSLDDFGTGYSSLSYLKLLPVNTVKIDRAFVKNLPSNKDDVAIAWAIIAMAHRLRLQVVAEGVETEDQLELLRELECDSIQGFLYSRPLPPEGVEELLRDGRVLETKSVQATNET